MATNKFDFKPTDYASSFTNIQSLVSGAQIDIDALISSLSGASANVSSLITNITGSTGNVIGFPNINVGNRTQGRKCTSSASETTLFVVSNAGFAFIQAHCASDATASAIVRVYDGAIDTNKLIAYAEIPSGTSQVVVCMPAYANNGFIVTAQADGTHNVCVYFSYYSPDAYASSEFTTSEATYGREGGADTNYGTSSNMYVGWNTSTNKYFSLLKFDLSSIPTGSMVVGASLVLTAASNRALQADFYIAECLRNWVRLEATWNSYSSGNAWTTPGGASGSDYAATPTWYGDLTGITTDLAVSFDVTSLVKDWVDGVKPNYGFFIRDEVPSAGQFTTWDTYLHATAVKRPKLIVDLI